MFCLSTYLFTVSLSFPFLLNFESHISGQQIIH
nr:MAG TPA: hypothetical protein [Caudoviricetes sp.]